MEDKIKGISLTSKIEKTPNSHVLDFDEDAPINLVDLSIVDHVIEILKYIDDNNLKVMRSENYDDFRNHMEMKFRWFSNRYESLFHKLIRGDDIRPFMQMIKAIDSIQTGKKTVEEAEKGVGDYLRDEFVVKGNKKKKKKKKKF